VKMAKQGKFDARAECMRMTSLSCMSEPQAAALMFLQAGDLRSFTDMINVGDVEEGDEDVAHWINLPAADGGANLLETAIELRKAEFIAQLLRVGARQDVLGEGSGLAPIHLAVLNNDTALLKLLLTDDGVDINLKAASFKNGHTPLHLAAEQGAMACLKLLLDHDEIDVDAKDIKGSGTPLLLAVKAKHQDAAKLLVENGASLDLKAGPKSLKEHMKEAFPGLEPTTIRVTRRREVMSNLRDNMFSLLRETELDKPDYRSKLGNFKTFLRFIWTLKDQNELNSIFDLAVKKGLHEHVELLLRKGCSVDTPDKPVLEASFHGLHKVLRVLRQNGATINLTTGSKETVLHLVLKQQSDGAPGTDYAKSLEEVLQWTGVKGLVNRRDDRDNTALHYATQKWGQDTVRKLLELGANVGLKNQWDEIPIAKIRPDTMEAFLSEFCLQSEGDVVHENFSISFRYDFLAPSPDSLPQKYRKDEETEELLGKEGEARQPLPETEPLWHMAQSKEHRHLLKHPVITSFLWYKWQRIRRYFNRNLRFFTLFVYMLTWYIFINFGGKPNVCNTEVPRSGLWYGFFILLSIVMCFFILKDWIADYKSYQRDKKIQSEQKIQDGSMRKGSCVKLTNIIFSSWVEAMFICVMVALIIFGSPILKILLGAFIILLLIRECLELSVSAKRYLSSLENWTEMTIVVLVSVLLINDCSQFELNRHLAAFSIVLSWAELIVMLGRHPKLKEYNIYVTMFLKVLKTFFFFLAWYSLFIVAFGLGFFILLHKTDDEPVGDDDYVFFNKAWLSLVKTTTMFVGELEFGDIPIDLESQFAPLAYVFFLSFVFLIVVVLMNLLNGLAVSDTGDIRDKAEIFSYRSQVETISTFESMLLGDPFDFLSNVPALLSHLPSCSLLRQLYRSNSLKRVFTAFGASEILLFYRFIPGKSVTIWPNRESERFCCLRVDEVGRSIVSAAKEIVVRQQVKGEPGVLDKVEQLQLQVASLEGMIRQLVKKMEK